MTQIERQQAIKARLAAFGGGHAARPRHTTCIAGVAAQKARTIGVGLAVFFVAMSINLVGVQAADEEATPADNPFAKAIETAQHRTVRIYGAGIGREHGYATGILVSADGLILTADGIYLAGRRLNVMLPDGRLYPATLVRRAPQIQTALIKIDAKTPTHFTLPQKPVGEAGDWVVAVSNAFKVADRGEPLSVNLGVISQRDALDTKRRMTEMQVKSDVIIIDAITANPGAPGGAVVTADGRLAGMIGKLIQSGDTNTWLNYAVPSDVLHRFVAGKPLTDDANDGGPKVVTPVGKPYVGIRLFTLSGKRAPAYVDRVLPGSPAAEAGLRKDDLILAIGDDRVPNIRAAEGALATLKPGEETTFTVKRRSTILPIRITPTAVKSND